jgi:hypothetical protein
MKKLLTTIAVAVFIIYPSICFASYVIHLKDGREFVTERYFEEGDQIKFKRYGGIIGIQKDLVKGVEEIEDVPEEKAEEEKPPQPAEPAKKETASKEKEKPPQKSLDEFYKKKKELTEKLDESLKRGREATRRKDKAAKQQAWEDMLRISKEIYALTDEVKEINGGELPDDWWKN